MGLPRNGQGLLKRGRVNVAAVLWRCHGVVFGNVELLEASLLALLVVSIHTRGWDRGPVGCSGLVGWSRCIDGVSRNLPATVSTQANHYA